MTHTVRPGLAPIWPDVDYSITVKVQRLVTGVDPDSTYAGLYARAASIADLRCREFARAHGDVPHWVMCHAWRAMPAGGATIAFAMIMVGLARRDGSPPPPGQPAPSTAELTTSGGATMEEMQQRSPQRASEVFVEFDHRLPTAKAAPGFMYSYSERVAGDSVDSFEPFVRRAERNARAHQALSSEADPSVTPFEIGHREWYLADRLVTVELQLKR